MNICQLFRNSSNDQGAGEMSQSQAHRGEGIENAVREAGDGAQLAESLLNVREALSSVHQYLRQLGIVAWDRDAYPCVTRSWLR